MTILRLLRNIFRSSNPEVLLEKSVLKKYRRTPIPKCVSIKLQSNFIEISLRHGCFPVNLLHFSEHIFVGTPLGGCSFIFYWVSKFSFEMAIIHFSTCTGFLPKQFTISIMKRLLHKKTHFSHGYCLEKEGKVYLFLQNMNEYDL